MGLKPKYLIEGSSDELKRRLISLTIVDNAKYRQDSLNITVSNEEPIVEFPEAGTDLKVSLGYEGEELIYQGNYRVNRTSLNFPLATQTVFAKALDPKKLMDVPTTKAYTFETLRSIVRSIAVKYNLEPIVTNRSPSPLELKMVDPDEILSPIYQIAESD